MCTYLEGVRSDCRLVWFVVTIVHYKIMMQLIPQSLEGNNDLVFFEEQITLALLQLKVPIEQKVNNCEDPTETLTEILQEA